MTTKSTLEGLSDWLATYISLDEYEKYWRNGQCRRWADAVEAAQRAPTDALDAKRMEIALDALAEISLAGMSLPMAAGGDEDGEQVQRFHAAQAWQFIGIATRARAAIAAG